MTGDIRQMVTRALEDAGGIQYLTEQARENPGPFLALVAKCMPRELIADVGPNLADALLIAMDRRRAQIADARVVSVQDALPTADR